ncbi:MAG TPA: amidohydrolase family protein [Mycobacteriales bacterium]|nr:amidohydrolase family protein [Mycobacteriales bacterium]
MSTPHLADINVLLGRPPRRDVGPGTVPALLSNMDRVGIAEAVVGHFQSWLHDPAEGNQQLIAELKGEPRLRPCWTMLPDSCGEIAPPAEFVTAAREAGVVAVRAYPHDHDYDLGGPDTAAMLDTLAAEGIPLLVDAPQAGWPVLEAVAKKHPTLRLIACRAGYRTLRRIAGVLGRTDNLYLDTANLSSHCGLEWLVERFGAERFFFGTANPEHDPAETVTRLLWSELSDEQVSTIGSENYRNLFGKQAA